MMPFGSHPELGFMSEILVRSTVLLALAWALHAALRPCNPRWRILLWRAIGCGLVLIPALTMLTPKVAVPIQLPIQRASQAAETPVISAVTSINQSNVTVLEQIQLSVADQVTPTAAAPTGSNIKPWPLLVSAWVGVACVLLLFYSIKYFSLHRILAASSPAPISMQRTLRKLTAEFECANPRLLVSSVIPAPILIGIFRPAILIPECLADDLTETDLAGILAHELSHLNSHDLSWTRFLQVLSTVLWFHPLVWRLRRAHDFACELVCDRVASDYSGGADQYSRTLADVALAMAGQWKPDFGLAMARRPDILTRLDFLNQKLKALPLHRGRKAIAIAMIMVLMGCITSVNFKPAQAENQKPVAQAGASASPTLAAISAAPTTDTLTAAPASVGMAVPMFAAQQSAAPAPAGWDPAQAVDQEPAGPMVAMAAARPMVAMQRTDVPSTVTEPSDPPMAAMAVPAGVPMVAAAMAEPPASPQVPMAAMAVSPASPPAAPDAPRPVAAAAMPLMRIASPTSVNNQRRIWLEITPFEVNETRAKEFSSDFRIPGAPSGQSHKTGNTTSTTSWDQAMVNTMIPGISKSFPDPDASSVWNLKLLESEGIINMAPAIRLTVRSGVSANIGYVVEGMDEAAVLKEFNRLLGDNSKAGDADITLTQPAKFSDFNFAQFGDRGGISTLIRILPRVTQKDGKDVTQLDIRALVLSRPLPEKNGEANPLLPSQWLKKSLVTDAIVPDGGSIVIGGWTGERHVELTNGVPVLGKLPIVGDKLFTKHMQERHRTTLMFRIYCKLD